MTPLEEKIRRRLAAGIECTFRDFMELALYDEVFGYYTTHTDRIGRRGDFYTSSSISHHFGELLAEQVARIQQALGHPPEFTVIEMGAGTGHLAADLLSALETKYPTVFAQTRYVICERSPQFRALQQTRLAGYGPRVRWSEPEQLSEPCEGLIFSNELVDAFPVHRLRLEHSGLLECFVELHHDRLTPVWKTPSRNQDFEPYLRRSGLLLHQGYEVEISLDAVGWLRHTASLLRRGFVLTIDYGDLSDHLSEEPQGTVRCFYQHRVNTDFFHRIGEQDMTADVNFSALMAYGEEFGLTTVRLERQGDFLIGLGLLDQLETLTHLEGDRPETLKERLALKHFLVPGGFGDHFKVLLQSKGL